MNGLSHDHIHGRGGERKSQTLLESDSRKSGKDGLRKSNGDRYENIYGGGGVQTLDCGRTPCKKKQEIYKPYILESFFYADEVTERLLPYFGDFMLDSGAFTFMSGNGGKVSWEEYVDRYSEFIKRNKIEKFFELDIDSVAGYEKVKELRKRIERNLTKQPIPVWHISRGIEEFKRMCDEYKYVAIGGIVSKEITREKYGAFPKLIAEAHKRGAKIHGLGFTNLALLPIYHWDSVDSTAWTTGNRFGYLYYFDGKSMKKKDASKGMKLGDSRAAALNNYTEWIKFQKYAENHL